MPNLNISHKLMLVVAALVVILLTTFCMFVVKINATSHLLENVAHPEKGLVVLTEESRLLQSIFKELRIAMIKYPMTVGTDERNKQKEAFKAQKQKFIEVLQIIQMRCDGKSEQCVGIAKSMINDLDDYEKASYNEVVRLTEINENREAYLAVQKFLVPIGSIIDAKVDSLVKVIDEKVETVQKKLESATSVWGIVTVNTLGLLLTVFIISVKAPGADYSILGMVIPFWNILPKLFLNLSECSAMRRIWCQRAISPLILTIHPMMRLEFLQNHLNAWWKTCAILFQIWNRNPAN